MHIAWTILQSTTGTGAAPAGGSNMLISFLPFILIIAIMYFLMLRPQAKKAKELQRMLEAITPGTDVITNGGIHGTVKGVKGQNNEILILQIAENVKIEIERSAVTRVKTIEGK